MDKDLQPIMQQLFVNEFHNHMCMAIYEVLLLNVTNLASKKDKTTISDNDLIGLNLKQRVQMKLRLGNKLLDEKYLEQSVKQLKKDKLDFLLNFLYQAGVDQGADKDWYYQAFEKLFDKVLLQITNDLRKKNRIPANESNSMGI